MSLLEAPPLPESQAVPAIGSKWSRMSDLLNPILVREVQQAIKGRVFPVTILLALGISVIIAAVVASNYVAGQTGRGAFDAGFATLIPLVLFIIPMQAYNSMRTELKGGIVEQLLLSRLSPGAVLSGKLQAAMVQFMLYVSVMSPLIATSYLLRGVDLPTIAISLVFALVICVAATAFAVSSAAQAVVPALQPIASLGIAFGLGFGTVAMVGFVASSGYSRSMGLLLRSGEFGMVASAVVGLALLATTLSWLAARTFLLHAFENKSTAFRIFLLSLPVLVFGWMLVFVSSSVWRFAFPGLAVALLVVGIVFGVFMVTEQRTLSPRVFAHVSASSHRARLWAPLLPGRDRGMLCFAIYTGFLGIIVLIGWPWISPVSLRSHEVLTVGVMVVMYALVYLGIARWVRDRLPDTVQGNHGGRVFVPVILFLFCLVPLLIDVLTRGRAQSWHIGHAMNPFWTIEKFYRVGDDALATCSVVLLVVIALHVRTFLRGLQEVQAASLAHRRRLVRAPADAEGLLADDSAPDDPAQKGEVREVEAPE